MAITRNSSARSSSPTPSENSDMYYDNFDNTSPSPAPSQTADPIGWESDGTPMPLDPRDATPTPAMRPSSPGSVVEISREESPPLLAETPATVVKPNATKAVKAKKGKGKAEVAETAAAEAVAHTNNADDPFLATDIARATTASLGIQTTTDNTTTGALSSRRLAAAPGSPSKRQHANTAGDAAPATFTPASAQPMISPLILAPVLATVVVPATAADAPTPTPATVSAVAATAVAVAPAAAAAVTRASDVAVPPTFAAAVTVPVQPAAATAPDQPAAVDAVLLPMWLTADGNPPRGSYTPTPAGGFPATIYSPELLLQGVPADLIQMYEAVPFPKFFLLVSGGNGAVMRTHGLICDAIGNFINVDPTSLTLGTPPTTANGTSPSL
ncbi:hypothetical protein DFH09DRAFT_1320727 [Mycena vulgaris]|nr:hypothetical protein DFH09DRAFT_1320727 [Mycena vulgaris]